MKLIASNNLIINLKIAFQRSAFGFPLILGIFELSRPLITLFMYFLALVHIKQKVHLQYSSLFLFTLSILLTSFYIQIANDQRWLIAYFICYSFCIATNSFLLIDRHKISVLVFTFSPIAIYLLTKKMYSFFATLLMMGYDNAFSISMYRIYIETNWFYFIDKENWASDFPTFQSYPSGQHAIWSFITEAFANHSELPREAVTSFAAINLMLVIAFALLANRLVTKWMIDGRNLQFEMRFLMNVCLLLSAGVFISNGWAQYMLATLVILAFIDCMRTESNDLIKLILVTCTVFSLQLIASGAVIFLIVYVIIESVRILMRVKRFRFSDLVLTAILITFFVTLMLIQYLSFSNHYGIRQILEPGGIYPPNIVLSSVVIIMFFLILLRLKFRIWNDQVAKVIISGILSFISMSAYIYINNKTLSYYGIKQFYFLLPILFMYVFSNIDWKSKNNSLLTKSLIVVLAISSSSEIMFGTSQGGGFMGSLPTALVATTMKSELKNNPVAISEILRFNGSKSDHKNDCYISLIEGKPHDLNSRWLNAKSKFQLNHTKCFMVYWNSDTLSESEISLRAKKYGVNVNFVR